MAHNMDQAQEEEIELDFGKKEMTEENPFVGKFEAFLKANYKKQIEKLVESYPQQKSLEVDYADLAHYDYQLSEELLANPDHLIEAAELAIKNIDVPALGIAEFAPKVRVFNLPKEQMPLLRDIGAIHLGKMIAVEGLVKEMTDVLPKLKLAAWQCRRCGNTYKIAQEGNAIKQPSMCECRHRDFLLQTDQSKFIDSQRLMIQEPLELLKGSEQATNVDIHLSEDLVNIALPGDRVCITGVVRLHPLKFKGPVYGRYLDATHVQQTQREFQDVEISKEEEKEIRKLSKNPKVYEMLIQSIAPSIYGHETIKEAIVLQLFGGVKKLLPGNMDTRGNIHVLLVGEPGLAKSKLLQTVHRIAPKSIYIAGKTSTGAGLTATAVKTDEYGEGGWVLKAGALVLANGGTIMVDEFEKMDEEDRGAMHEAMEQGMISVAKAGIVTRFKSETSVLAAANPKYTRFDPYQNFMEQIDLPASLISRFDLFFLITDVLDRKRDEEIATHILKTHQAGEMMLQRAEDGKKKEREPTEIEKAITPEVPQELFRKYVSYARQKLFPIMSDEAMKSISDFYVNLREQGKVQGSYAATHRQLEGLVRLSEASARVRLSNEVEMEDTERAIRLLRSSLEKVVTDKETGRIDIDLITAGVPKSQVDHMRKILNLVKEKSAELDLVPLDLVFEEMKSEGIDKEKTMDFINRLEKKGDLYMPKHGFVKPVEK